MIWIELTIYTFFFFVGVVSVLAGSTTGYLDATGTNAKFYSPQGVAVDSSGTVFVSDSMKNNVRKITTAGFGLCCRSSSLL